MKDFFKRLDAAGFRPLAGFWFLNMGRKAGGEEMPLLFPSPCGVLVLKLDADRVTVDIVDSFRPLAGFWFLNSSRP